MRASRVATVPVLLLVVMAGLLAATQFASAASAAIDCDQQSLQPKLDHAAPGATILISGKCVGNFLLAKNLTLQGNPSAVITANLSGRVLQVNGAHTIHLRSLRITHGRSTAGAGIAVTDGVLTLDHVTMRDDVASGDGNEAAGGAILAMGTQLTIRDSVLAENVARSSGAIVEEARGGGVFLEGGSLTVEDTVIRNNEASASSGDSATQAFGGGVYVEGAAVSITSSQFLQNAAVGGGPDGAVGLGGAIFFRTVLPNPFSVSDTSFALNLASAESNDKRALARGGAAVVFPEAGSVSFLRTHFGSNLVLASSTNDTARAEGGSLQATSDGPIVRLQASEVRDSAASADAGGGLAEAGGGGIEVDGPFAMTGSVVSGNEALAATDTGLARALGGAYWGIRNATTIGRTTLDGNSVEARSDGTGAIAEGGGIATEGTATVVLQASTVSGNTATSVADAAPSDASGGGMSLASNSQTDRIVNSTITGNEVVGKGGNTPSSRGGGIATTVEGLDVKFVTIARNEADAVGTSPSIAGGGLDVGIGTTRLVGTILAANLAPTGPNCRGEPESDGFNLIANAQGCALAFLGTDQAGVPAGLGAFALHGGPTKTIPLLAGSPAIDRVPVAKCQSFVTRDQRGIKRPQGPKCDEGSFERKP